LSSIRREPEGGMIVPGDGNGRCRGLADRSRISDRLSVPLVSARPSSTVAFPSFAASTRLASASSSKLTTLFRMREGILAASMLHLA